MTVSLKYIVRKHCVTKSALQIFILKQGHTVTFHPTLLLRSWTAAALQKQENS